MPDGSGATVLEDLPEEIMDNILVRLPSRDVGRCRTVSASWRSATSTPELVRRYHRCQPSLPIIDGRSMLVAFRAGISGGSQQQKLWPFLHAEHRPEIRLRGACDGFLVISCQQSRFYICKRPRAPATAPTEARWDLGAVRRPPQHNLVLPAPTNRRTPGALGLNKRR